MGIRLSIGTASLVALLLSIGFINVSSSACDKITLDMYVTDYCMPVFNESVESLGYRERCPWPESKLSYTALSDCVVYAAQLLGCQDYAVLNQHFLEIHRVYYSLCTYMEHQQPGLDVVLPLALPCVITTLLFPFLCVYIFTKNKRHRPPPTKGRRAQTLRPSHPSPSEEPASFIPS